MLAIVEKELPIAVKIVDVAVCGHEITTPELYEQARERNGTSGFIESVLLKLDIVFDIWNSENKLREVIQDFENIKLDPKEFDTTQDIYQSIENSMHLLDKVQKKLNILLFYY